MIGAALLIAVALLAYFGFIPMTVLMAVFPSAALLLGVNDNTALAKDATAAITDAVTAATTGHLQTALPKLIGDAMKVVGDVRTPLPIELTGTSLPIGIQSPPSGVVPGAAAILLLLAATVTLSACTVPEKQLACVIDQWVQPIAAETAQTLVPGGAAAVSLDQLVVHPAVVNYCASLGAKPAAVPVSQAPAAPGSALALAF